MNRYIIPLIVICCTAACVAQPIVNIIPAPAAIEVKAGTLSLDQSFVLLDENNLFANELTIFSDQLSEIIPFSIKKSTNKKAKKAIRVVLNTTPTSNPEAYKLSITATGITIQGSVKGVFYGLQSLYQLIAANASKNATQVALPQLVINDAPSYRWRGMHLDVCRHFFTKEEVKKYIDYLALHKLNTFHWHLTEDQGWRIEIKKYPLLTSIGSKRNGTIIGPYSTTAKSDNIPHEGFYTQEDIREVVAYAMARHITVVPEIEMPGHALAALSAYPEFSCTGGPFQPAITWGVFNDVFCAGNDATFTFLEDILSEVIPLFPGKYIHIGGDECPKIRWERCAKCQQRMKDEHLEDEHALQSYFITRIEKFVNSKGKQIIGWDEILEGGLAPNAAVMSWRGIDGGIAAAKQKHEVVMSPGQPCYFDHYQVKEKESEPLAIGGYNPLEAVYAYNPTPTQLTESEQQYILGAQANVWTEYMPTFSQVEYMALPRMCALAETLWTPQTKKDYANFQLRLKKHAELMDVKKINYAKHFLQKP